MNTKINSKNPKLSNGHLTAILMAIITVSLLVPSITKAESFTVTDTLDSMNFSGRTFIVIDGSKIMKVDPVQTNATTSGAASENATSITKNSATLVSTIISGSGISVRGFEYGPTPLYGSTTRVTGSNLTGVLKQQITGLLCNTTYYFRSYASNDAGTGYGRDLTFKTASCRLSIEKLSDDPMSTSTRSASSTMGAEPTIYYKNTNNTSSATTVATSTASTTKTNKKASANNPSPTPTPSPSYSVRPIATPTASPASKTSPTVSPTPSPTVYSAHPVINPSIAATPTPTPFNTPATAISPTPSPTYSPAPSPTARPSNSPTPSPSPVSRYGTSQSASGYNAFGEWLRAIFQ